ncbi:MAG: twin-arginine translocase subunit TatB [Proteobacteria bacterium]|jgi:sec-independent protein translocase protein TatB|nr:twin-arginine translocase subunit TatB [Pseudomonadota bacterium]MDP6949669.1 Sec-independent protein translocase protein TatB [Arenicellales bacterium]HJP08027.1 Sec-independent protein translocase protein TatB [Arenicellales bacterium]|tara:strand:+ start:1114 stop:1458 length:345 start_codon:yes stop_codon:yes gene_type:complete
MFDIGFLEIVIIAAIALVILGPERLPRAARTAGLWVGRARRMVADVKSDIDREIRESELADMRKLGEEVNSVKDDIGKAARSMTDNDGMGDVVDSIKESAETLRQDATEKTGTG